MKTKLTVMLLTVTGLLIFAGQLSRGTPLLMLSCQFKFSGPSNSSSGASKQ